MTDVEVDVGVVGEERFSVFSVAEQRILVDVVNLVQGTFQQ